MPMHIWGRGKLSVGSRQPDAGCLFVCFRLLLLLATGAAEPLPRTLLLPDGRLLQIGPTLPSQWSRRSRRLGMAILWGRDILLDRFHE